MEVLTDTKAYIQIIFYGIIFTSIYNYFAAVIRSMGNSIIPLLFLIISTIINIVLDFIFVVPFHMDVEGAAYATIIAQGFSTIGFAIYSIAKIPQIRLNKKNIHFNKNIIKMIANYSVLSSIQQSIMNFGILMIQNMLHAITAFLSKVQYFGLRYHTHFLLTYRKTSAIMNIVHFVNENKKTY